jgi:hypothetical protein
MDYLKLFEDYCDKLIETKKVIKPENMSDEEWKAKRIDEINYTKKIIEVSMTKQIMRVKNEALQKDISIINLDFQMVKEIKMKEFININFYKNSK